MKATTNSDPVRLAWLDGARRGASETIFGVPWAEGELSSVSVLRLAAANGAPNPVQSWPLAFWPDGTVKWSGHAASFEEDPPAELTIAPTSDGARDGEPGTSPVVRVDEHEEYVRVRTRFLSCQINRSGANVLSGLALDGTDVCSRATLVAIREDRFETSGRQTTAFEEFETEIRGVTVEQSGPVRAVVRVDGRHRSSGRTWLPFRLRLSFFAQSRRIGIVHSFTYDGNPNADFIRGIGLRFAVPMSGPLYNRHVRIAGETGYFTEASKSLHNRPLQLAATGRRDDGELDRYIDLYRQQQRGARISLDEERDEEFRRVVDDAPVWSSFRVVQRSADSWSIDKRTAPGRSWAHATSGARARGLIYAGSERGGLAVGLRSFWEKSPSALEVHGLSSDEADLVCWLWSPEAGAMDLRHYDAETHVESAYEGGEELRSTPYGIANTSELSLWCLPETPSYEACDRMVDQTRSPARLVCDPARYHETGAFGTWSLPDRATPAKAWLEDRLDELVDFYMDEVELRRWYGFWNYGDVMHSYDPIRHTWCYDLGGFAWQNTELVPNMWLWYSFLRSGRADVFRMAEAMTRHTSEVDLYHIGEYQGLGSRHNVVHWGCTAKEARIGMAHLHRFYYYLTADERTGDIIDEVRDADYATVRLDPMRAYFPKDGHPTHVRSGPDWAAFASNWYARWERFGDVEYREKLQRGIDCLASMPHRLLSGPTFGYDPKSGNLSYLGEENYSYHMIVAFGAPQVWLELLESLDEPRRSTFAGMLAEFGEFYAKSETERAERARLGHLRANSSTNWNTPLFAAAMIAFAARHTARPELAERVWEILLTQRDSPIPMLPLERTRVDAHTYPREVTDAERISTNAASQWALNVIVCLELAGEELPETAPR